MRGLIIFVFSLFLVKDVFALTITEIMFNPEGNDLSREWLEVVNNTNQPLEILSGRNGWRINDGSNHLFKENIQVGPGEIFVIVQDKETFLKEYPNFNGKAVQANFSLKNENGKIQIFDEKKNLLTEVSYQKSCGGDNNGYTIIFENNTCQENKIKGGTPGSLLINVSEKKDEKDNFEVQINPSSSPLNEIPVQSPQGEIFKSPQSDLDKEVTSMKMKENSQEFSKFEQNQSIASFKSLIISEFFPNPVGNDTGQEFVEIYNESDSNLELEGFRLEIGITKLNLTGSIKANGYLIISNKEFKFNIRNNGEELKLFYKNNPIFSISYNGKAPEGLSFSKMDDGSWKFTQPTPAKKNLPPQNFDKAEIIKDVIDEVEKQDLMAQVNFNKSLERETAKINNTSLKTFLFGLFIILILTIAVWLKL